MRAIVVDSLPLRTFAQPLSSGSRKNIPRAGGISLNRARARTAGDAGGHGEGRAGIRHPAAGRSPRTGLAMSGVGKQAPQASDKTSHGNAGLPRRYPLLPGQMVKQSRNRHEPSREAPRDQAGRPCYKPWDQLKPLAKIRSGPLIVKLPGLSAKKMLPEQRTRTRAIRSKGNHLECQLGVQPRWPIGSLEAAPTRPRKARVSICRLTISDHATANTNRWILRQPGNRRICGK